MARLPRLCVAGHPHLIVHRRTTGSRSRSTTPIASATWTRFAKRPLPTGRRARLRAARRRGAAAGNAASVRRAGPHDAGPGPPLCRGLQPPPWPHGHGLGRPLSEHACRERALPSPVPAPRGARTGASRAWPWTRPTIDGPAPRITWGCAAIPWSRSPGLLDPGQHAFRARARLSGPAGRGRVGCTAPSACPTRRGRAGCSARPTFAEAMADASGRPARPRPAAAAPRLWP